MPMHNSAWRASACALATILTVFSSQANADSGGNLDLQAFRPAQDSKGMVTLDRSQVLGHLEPSMGLVTGWAKGLLKLEGNESTYRVEHVLSPTLLGALGLRVLGQELQVGVALPFRVVSGDRSPDAGADTPNDPNDDQNYSFEGQGIGNLDLQLKWRLLDTSRSRFGLAVAGGVELPTVSEPDRWLGADTTTPHLRIIADTKIGSLGIAANAGIRMPLASRDFVDDTPPVISGIAGPMTGVRVASGLALPYGVGLSYMLVPETFEVIAEVFGQVVPNAENYQPVEALTGIKVYLAQSSFLSLGGGAGLRPDTAGSPDARAYLGIVFEPNVGDRDSDGLKDDVDQCPDDPEDYDDFQDSDGCPEPDNDLDGILDVEDACPNTPEDRDGVDDEDGCPEDEPLDRDGDGVVDVEDDCPDDPEDVDQFDDLDGCPDVDNDGDRILDVDDLCPDDPEDLDGFEDFNGCPDIDNDGDRIPDEDDECPRVDGESAEETREVYNTVDDDDGCPDRGPLTTTAGGIIILKKVHFRYNSAEILDNSFDILHAVAMTMNTNEQLTLIEVQGHTDERGSREYNRELSQRRAEAVVAFLVKAGVDTKRLRAVGYGEDEPKIRKHTEAAWAANRRVEFIIR